MMNWVFDGKAMSVLVVIGIGKIKTLTIESFVFV